MTDSMKAEIIIPEGWRRLWPNTHVKRGDLVLGRWGDWTWTGSWSFNMTAACVGVVIRQTEVTDD